METYDTALFDVFLDWFESADSQTKKMIILQKRHELGLVEERLTQKEREELKSEEGRAAMAVASALEALGRT